MDVNHIDLLILLGLGLYVLLNASRGAIFLAADLGILIGSVRLSFRIYGAVADLLIEHASMPASFAKAAGFVAVLVVLQILLGTLARHAMAGVPRHGPFAALDRALAVVPAALHGLILTAALLFLLLALPLSPALKADIEASRLGSMLVDRAAAAEEAFASVFGGALRETVTYLTVQPERDERVELHARPASLSVDRQAEQRMLELVNEERLQRGLAPLTVDPTLMAVACAHSTDMWERGYSGHVNPDGEDPFDRMRAGGVDFLAAGENLALAPTTERAHRGLMNSPGHRRNILDPAFTRVGIGAISGGVHGTMFTQNFAN